MERVTLMHVQTEERFDVARRNVTLYGSGHGGPKEKPDQSFIGESMRLRGVLNRLSLWHQRAALMCDETQTIGLFLRPAVCAHKRGHIVRVLSAT